MAKVVRGLMTFDIRELDYRAKGHKPDYNKLPSKPDYDAAEAARKTAGKTKNPWP
jgi:hypothetical protein